MLRTKRAGQSRRALVNRVKATQAPGQYLYVCLSPRLLKASNEAPHRSRARELSPCRPGSCPVFPGANLQPPLDSCPKRPHNSS